MIGGEGAGDEVFDVELLRDALASGLSIGSPQRGVLEQLHQGSRQRLRVFPPAGRRVPRLAALHCRLAPQVQLVALLVQVLRARPQRPVQSVQPVWRGLLALPVRECPVSPARRCCAKAQPRGSTPLALAVPWRSGLRERSARAWRLWTVSACRRQAPWAQRLSPRPAPGQPPAGRLCPRRHRALRRPGDGGIR